MVSIMRRRVLGVGTAIGLLFVLGLVASVPAYGAPQGKVTLCHATNSVGSPYTEVTVNINSVVKPGGTPTGHGTHTGPVYPTPGWGDIIPPFQYNNDHGGVSTYPGMNWSGHGQDIWHGGCLVVLVEPPIPPTTTTTPPTTTTTPPATTTTPPATTSTPLLLLRRPRPLLVRPRQLRPPFQARQPFLGRQPRPAGRPRPVQRRRRRPSSPQ